MCMYVLYGQHIQRGLQDHPGMVANPARGQLNREKCFALSLCQPRHIAANESRHVGNDFPPREKQRDRDGLGSTK